MTDTTVATEHPGPSTPKVKRRRKVAKRRTARPRGDEPPAPPRNEFAGMTSTMCPDACTAERCIVSTVSICKHPSKSADSGCGPLTMRTRERAKRYLKRLKADA